MHPHYNDEVTKNLILEGWDRWDYEEIHSMPKRLRDVGELGGQLTRYEVCSTQESDIINVYKLHICKNKDYRR